MTRRYSLYGDRRRQDIWTLVENMIPTSAGNYMTARVWAQTIGAGPVTPGTTLKAWAGINPAGTAIYVVGTTTKLYTTDTGTWTDRTKVGGYTATDWSFAQYGVFTIASNKADAMQVRDSTGVAAFADLGGTPPKAKIIVTQSNAVLAFNINNGTDQPDAWAASDVGNHANWTTGEAVAATKILHRPGAITAAVAFKDEVIVFKANSVYRMRYVGSPIYWMVDLIADGIGCADQCGAVVCGDVVAFLGSHGGYIFDGASFRGAAVDDVRAGLYPNAITGSAYWPQTRSVWFGRSGSVSVYNLSSDRWGFFSVYKSASTTALSSYVMMSGNPALVGLTEASNYMVDLSSTPSLASSSANWGDQGAVLARVGTGYLGSGDDAITTFTRVTPMLSNHSLFPGSEVDDADMSMTAVAYTSAMDKDASVPSWSPATSSTPLCRFDFTHSSRYLVVYIGSSTKSFEISDVLVKARPGGES